MVKSCQAEPPIPVKMASREVGVWSFGYGSNMDMVALQNKKGVRVLEHGPAVLHNFRLTFSTKGLDFVEPGFAGLGKEEGAEVRFCETFLVLFDFRCMALHSAWGRRAWRSWTRWRLATTRRPSR